ncbi:IRL7 [Symbiodinium microadriaticum]|nr:IRL7 [Symbiodinium microadriaticum]
MSCSTDVLARITAGEVFSEVNLSNRGLTEFPMELLKLQDSLEVLNLGGNNLSSLPPEVSCFRKLRILFFAGNKFEVMPEQLGSLSSLYMLSFKSNKLTHIPPDSLSPSVGWLILTDNSLTKLPDTIGNLRGLRKLMLANNRLSELPRSMSRCTDLELIRLSRNKLSELPLFLLDLPKLSWISLAGNCIPGMIESHSGGGALSARGPTVPLSALCVGPKIGEGASGYVHETKWKSEEDYFRHMCDGASSSGTSTSQWGNLLGSDGSPFAYKVFKGQCGSDGHPEDEIKACMDVGYHCNILSAAACVVNEDTSANESDAASSPMVLTGLLLPLIPPSCISLGGTPSFVSVTRDVYEPTACYSPLFVGNVLSGISSAMKHLHSRGMLHGDLYAHNIHIYPDGTPLLMDFGASFQCDMEVLCDEFALLQRLEVRAFGCLVEELLARMQPANGDMSATELTAASVEKQPQQVREISEGVRKSFSLSMLRDACTQTSIKSRPSFDSICDAIGPATHLSY